MINTPSIKHSYTLNFQHIIAMKKKRGRPTPTIVNNTTYHVKLSVGEFFAGYGSRRTRTRHHHRELDED